MWLRAISAHRGLQEYDFNHQHRTLCLLLDVCGAEVIVLVIIPVFGYQRSGSSRGYNHVDEGGGGHDIGWHASARKKIGMHGVDENAGSSAVGIDETYDGGGGAVDRKCV